MNFKFIKRGVVLATLLASLLAPQVSAAESFVTTKQALPKEISLNGLTTKTIDSKAFVTTEDGVALVRECDSEESNLVGKVFEKSLVKILEKGKEWTKIESGNVVGYVETGKLITGKKAVVQIKKCVEQAYLGVNIYTLTEEQMEAAFVDGETVEEEKIRLAEEEAKRIEAEKEASRKKGEEIVSYAQQFIGNPYVYGGTSLTRGTDCSGFVMGVYRHFGVSLPRTSYQMRKVGRAVQYSDMQPGDIVCYSGHVGIYAGNGKIVNAIDEQRGINLSNAGYKRIITIRRIF